MTRTTKIKKLVQWLNAMPIHQPMFQSALLHNMGRVTGKTYRNYLGLLKREGFLHKEGRGRTAVVTRHKRLPEVKLRVTLVER